MISPRPFGFSKGGATWRGAVFGVFSGIFDEIMSRFAVLCRALGSSITEGAGGNVFQFRGLACVKGGGMSRCRVWGNKIFLCLGVFGLLTLRTLCFCQGDGKTK